MTRIFTSILCFAVVSALLLSACDKKQNASAGSAGSASADRPKVTFIELGSVNCVPCKMMVPVMKKVEETFKDRVAVLFYDVWTEEGRPFGELYAIQAIPTQIFLDEEGVEYFRHVGYFPYEELVKVLEKKGVK